MTKGAEFERIMADDPLTEQQDKKTGDLTDEELENLFEGATDEDVGFAVLLDMFEKYITRIVNEKDNPDTSLREQFTRYSGATENSLLTRLFEAFANGVDQGVDFATKLTENTI